MSLRRTRAAVIVLATLVPPTLAACGDAGSPVERAASAPGPDPHASGSVRLPEALSALGAVRTDTLHADRALGAGLGESDVFTFVGDVAAGPGGRIAVLDRLDPRVRVFSATGEPLFRFGREGDGPGELDAPIAVEWLGDHSLVVWDRDGRLSRYTVPSGALAREVALPEEQDWMSLMFQHPVSAYDQPIQLPEEDVTRRLVGTGAGLVLHTQRDRSDAVRTVRDTVHFVVVDSLLEMGDTVASLPAPPLVHREDLTLTRTQEVWPGRPLLAAGDGWIASAHGADTAVTVRASPGAAAPGSSTASGDLLRVVWPAAAEPITGEHHDLYVEWSRDVSYRRSDTRVRAFIRSLPPEEARRIGKGMIAQRLFPDRAPEIMGMLGAGPCLFLAGFGPGDEYRAESLTWAVVDVPGRRLARVVRLPERATRVRAVTPSSMIATRVDEDGRHLVTSYVLPAGGTLCG